MFKSEEEFNSAEREGRKMGPQSEKHKRVALKLDELAKKKNTLITSVALAYVMAKAPYVFRKYPSDYPHQEHIANDSVAIIGGRKVDHLKGNIEALSVELSDEEIAEIEGAEPFDIGFPLNMLFEYGGKQKYNSRMTAQDIPLVTTVTRLESVPKGRVSAGDAAIGSPPADIENRLSNLALVLSIVSCKDSRSLESTKRYM